MQIRPLTTLVCLLLSATLWGQTIEVEHLKALHLRNIGPAGMSGRVTAIDVDLSQPQRIFVGTASGGVWKSESGGTAWEPIFEEESTQAIGALAINQRSPSEIWVGTGEGNPRNSLNSGNGIYKSLDGGRNWQHLGLEGTKQIHRILIHRDDPNTVFVGALGSPWGASQDRGVYKTTDGGKTWRKVLYVNEETGCADLVVDPTNPNKLIAAMWEYGRKPWTFNSGGKGSGMYVSFDGGETWEKRTEKDGLPKGDLGRIGLAIAPSKPNIVYALVEAKENGLYRSTDGGFNWSKRSTDDNFGNRPFYYSDLFVDSQNENRIFSLHSTMTISEDGGKTFQRFLPFNYFSGVHPDHHAFWIHPNDPNYIVEGNDGGLYITRNGGETWQFAENLPVGQFYHVDYDLSIPYRVCGGMQDNGSWVGPAYTWQRGGIRNHEWQEVYFGDGFDVGLQAKDPRFGYAMSQGGNLARFNLETGETKSIRPVHPDGIPLRFNWNAAFALNPQYDCGLYYGSQFLHKSLDCGNTWEIISPDLTTNDTTRQKQHLSGGLTIDDTEAENYTTITAIGPSPIARNVVWVGTDDGRLHITRNGGETWTSVENRLPGCPSGSWFAQIVPSSIVTGEAFVVVNNYRRNDWQPMVYRTSDYGETFTRIVDDKQVDGYALSIAQDYEEGDFLWLGTDQGLYFTFDGGRNWNKWTNDYPSVPTRDLKIHPRELDLIVGTFGRSIWILDDIRPLREIARTKGQVLKDTFRVFPAPDAYLASYSSVEGARFPADGAFIGENRSSGGRITLWVKPDSPEPKPAAATGKKRRGRRSAPPPPPPAKEDDKKEKKRPEKVTVQVIDEAGDTIRTFSREVDTGMVRLSWDLRRNGVTFPSRRDRGEDRDPPGGTTVLPGTYRLVFSYGDHLDSTSIVVHPDPRVEIEIEGLQAQQARILEFYKLVETASEAFDRLKEAKKTIKLVNEQLVNAPDSTQKAIKERGKALQDSLANLEKLFLQPDGLKGIQRSSDNINSYLQQALSYLGDSDRPEPSQMATISVQKARTEVNKAVEKINALFANDWKTYQQEVEAVKYSLFKEFKPIEQKQE